MAQPIAPRGLPFEKQPRAIRTRSATKQISPAQPSSAQSTIPPPQQRSRRKRNTQATDDAPSTAPGSRSSEATPDNAPLSSNRRDRSKNLSILEGSLNSVTVGLTSNFVSAFAVALGVSNFVIGMVATLPSLVGAIVQLLVTIFRKMFATRKKHIVFFAVLQALMWLPLLYAPALHNPGPWLVLFITLNTVFGMLIGPVWNSWMGDIIEEDERGKFFGRRNMFTGITAFISTIFAGWILTALKVSYPLGAFGILFLLACVFRLMSAYYLNKMDDPSEGGLDDAAPNPIDFIINADKTSLGRFTIFLMFFNIAVYIAAPFFAVYQLSILGFSYFTFTLLACASAISSFVTMLMWGHYVDKLGSRNVLVACGFLIPFVPLFWGFTRSVPLLFMVEVFSGIAWAGFNLSVSTYLFDATERKNRTRELAEYTLMIQLAVFVGAMLGSTLLGMFDKTNPLGFKTVFFISAALRMLAIMFFFKSLKELRIIEVPVKDRLFKRFVSIRPHHGIVYEPSVENRRLAGATAMKSSKDISREMHEELNAKKPSKMKQLEMQEDAEDAKEYLKRLKR